nr:MAG TPA: hypothetical protein [Caudoviricetes sp.]
MGRLCKSCAFTPGWFDTIMRDHLLQERIHYGLFCWKFC